MNCKLERLVRIVQQQQFTEGGPPNVRYLARRLRVSQREVLQLCEDKGLNVNIGIQCGNGHGVFDRIGDYTVEDLSVDDANAEHHARPERSERT